MNGSVQVLFGAANREFLWRTPKITGPDGVMLRIRKDHGWGQSPLNQISQGSAAASGCVLALGVTKRVGGERR